MIVPVRCGLPPGAVGSTFYEANTRTFTAFKSKENEPGSLNHDIVRAVYEDRQGTLWVLTWNGGLNGF